MQEVPLPQSGEWQIRRNSLLEYNHKSLLFRGAVASVPGAVALAPARQIQTVYPDGQNFTATVTINYETLLNLRQDNQLSRPEIGSGRDTQTGCGKKTSDKDSS